MAPAIPVAAAAGAAASASAAGAGVAAGAAVAGTAAAASATAGAATAITAGSWLSSVLVGSAATATSAASAGLIGFGGSLTVGGVLSGLFTVGSSLATLYGMKTQADAAGYDAKVAKFQARQEKLAGRVEANAIKKSMIETLASQRARWGAAGVDISSGTAQVAQAEAKGDADLQYGMARSDAETRAMARRIAARNARSRVASGMFEGGLEAASGLVDLYGNAVNRGM